MDAHIQIVRDKYRKAIQDADKFKKALEALQDICEHDWLYDGLGYNLDFYTCSKCGASKEED